jgi:NTP pyrophosphatase (non-canonical NTP hydrolase)
MSLPIMNGDHAEFEREWAGKDPKTRPDWPLPSFNAMDWAEAFGKIFIVSKINGHLTKPVDEQDGLMLAWFASALMRGLDEGRSRGMNLNNYRDQAHADNLKWWQDITTGEPIKRNKGELLMLIVSELAEAMEGERKELMDDKLPHRKMAEVELADALIRIFDYAGGYGYDLEGAYQEKRAFNATRADHSHAARLAEGGKKF